MSPQAVLFWGSVVLAALDFAQNRYLATGRRRAWATQALIQVPYVAYIALTGQWGFLLLAAGYTWNARRGWLAGTPPQAEQELPLLPAGHH